eukprot:g7470.t1
MIPIESAGKDPHRGLPDDYRYTRYAKPRRREGIPEFGEASHARRLSGRRRSSEDSMEGEPRRRRSSEESLEGARERERERERELAGSPLRSKSPGVAKMKESPDPRGSPGRGSPGRGSPGRGSPGRGPTPSPTSMGGEIVSNLIRKMSRVGGNPGDRRRKSSQTGLLDNPDEVAAYEADDDDEAEARWHGRWRLTAKKLVFLFVIVLLWVVWMVGVRWLVDKVTAHKVEATAAASSGASDSAADVGEVVESWGGGTVHTVPVT